MAKRGRKPKPVPEAARPLLGTLTDTTLARMFGVAPHTATRWREEAGIPRLQQESCKDGQKPSNGRGRPKIPTPEEAKPLLGVLSDAKIAKRFKVSHAVAVRWREEAGIPKPPKTPREPPAVREEVFDRYPGIRERLGLVSDGTLADEYGVSREWIRQLRGIDDIPSFQGQRSKSLQEEIIPLLPDHRNSVIRHLTGATASLIETTRIQQNIPEPERKGKYEDSLKLAEPLMGTMSDRKLAQMFDVPDTRIHQRRVELGIAPFQQYSRHHPLDKARIRELFRQGKSDVEIAEILGSSAHSIQQVRLRMRLLRGYQTGSRRPVDRAYIRTQILQGRDDTEIASEAGCGAGTVAYIRRKMGKFIVQQKLPWDKIIPLLGTMPDRELGAMFNTAGATICMKRRALGIPSFQDQQGSQGDRTA